MRILIVTSCTGEKVVEHERALVLEDFKQGESHVAEREKELDGFLTPAAELYSGQQHVRLMRGVQAFRGEIELWVLSAGYGIVEGERKLAPYEATFNGMKKKELRSWADQLGVPEDFRKAVEQPYDLGLLLLGDAYIEACAIDGEMKLGGPTFLFCGGSMAKRLPEVEGMRKIALSNVEAKRFSCGLVALKGELVSRLLDRLREIEVEGLVDEVDVLGLLDGETDQKEPAEKGEITAESYVDWVIQVPQNWWGKPHRKKLMYFIPEWDDLVDPDFDFENDIHSSGKGSWENEVYAHQMFEEPNYDGILISKIVAERNKKKKERINKLGVHRYLRVPAKFPILGDCGAFGYINEEVPPYSTQEILEYYTRLGFDYGVSIDHLIVSATGDQKKQRYELTIQNAEDFLSEHRKMGLDWEPIGAVQGWDPKSYANAARKYVDMGYKYIALGGLVRSQTKDILDVLHEVHQVVPDEVNIHLFGLARLQALNEFAVLGVRSVDSASHLRRAWLGAKDNFWTIDGQVYAAIRIPEAEKSFRAKRIVSEGRADINTVKKLEKTCLKAILDYDTDRISIEGALETLIEYDQLISPDRRSMREAYERTLQDKPWKTCPCDICQKDGVQVIIFRGNNRNRRRGFHNTFSFYRLLQEVLGGKEILSGNEKKGDVQLSLFPREGR